MPLAFIAPMMPMLVDEPPEGDEWTHEVKYDGYRSQIIIDKGIRIFTRNGKDWTQAYKFLAEDAASLKLKSAIIDGEIVVLNDRGLPDFGSLRSAIKARPRDLYFVAFDLLHFGGKDLRQTACEERRNILRGLIPAGKHIQFSEAIDASAAEVYRMVDAADLEGMVSKRRDSTYRSGNTYNWKKTKCYSVDEYMLLGVEREAGKAAFALLADRETGEYAGSAFITLERFKREELWARVEAKPGEPPDGMKPRPAALWTKPGMVMRVKHLRGEEMLRHASVEDFWEE
ncbi:ATP-dependent DNA ligase [Mesorhizobium amorphae]